MKFKKTLASIILAGACVLGVGAKADAGKIGLDKQWSDGTTNLNTGLTAYYDFDKTSELNVPDKSDNSYDANPINMRESNWVSGLKGDSLKFDGVNDYVTQNTLLDDLQKDLTISMWFKLDTSFHSPDSVLDPYLFSKTNLKDSNRFSALLRGGKGKVWLWGEGANQGPFNTFSSKDNWEADKWHNLVFNWDDTNNRVDMYANGVHQNRTTYNFPMSAGNFNDFTIGYNPTIGFERGVHFFKGEIDEFGVWNRSLNQSEVRQLYNNGEGITIVPEPSTLGLLSAGSLIGAYALRRRNSSREKSK